MLDAIAASNGAYRAVANIDDTFTEKEIEELHNGGIRYRAVNSCIQLLATLDGKPVGTGKPGPYAEQMWQWYQDFKNTVMRKG